MGPIRHVGDDDHYKRGGPDFRKRLTEGLSELDDGTFVPEEAAHGKPEAVEDERALFTEILSGEVDETKAKAELTAFRGSDPEYRRRRERGEDVTLVSDVWAEAIAANRDSLGAVVLPEMADEAVAYHLIATVTEERARSGGDGQTATPEELRRILTAKVKGGELRDEAVADELVENFEADVMDPAETLIARGRSHNLDRRLANRGWPVTEVNPQDDDFSADIDPDSDQMHLIDWLAMTADLLANDLDEVEIDGRTVDCYPDDVDPELLAVRDRVAEIVREGHHTDVTELLDEERDPQEQNWATIAGEFQVGRSPLDRTASVARRFVNGIGEAGRRLAGSIPGLESGAEETSTDGEGTAESGGDGTLRARSDGEHVYEDPERENLETGEEHTSSEGADEVEDEKTDNGVGGQG